MTKIVSLPLEGNTNPAFSLALRYAAQGWRVFPVNAATKKPWDPVTNRLMTAWHDRATVDLHEIAAWWEKRPDLGVGIATGRKTGIVGLDFDVTKDKDGLKDLAALEAVYGPLPETLTQSTPSGGTQRFYRYPDDTEDVPNRQGFGHIVAGHQSRALCGIDVRGDGGQVNVPPTSRQAGAYRWQSDPFKTEIAELPARWVEELRETALAPAKPSMFDDPDAVIEAGWGDGKGSAETVLAGCAAIDQLRTDPKAVTEWQWKMGAGVIGRCERGPVIFDALSKLDPDRYSTGATKAALDYMLKKSGPHGCEAFVKEVPDVCAKCLIRGKLKTPSQLAAKRIEMVQIQRSHFYVVEGQIFYDVYKQITLNKLGFSDTYAHVNIRYTEVTETKDGPKYKEKTKRGAKAALYLGDAWSAKADVGRYEPGRLEKVYQGPNGVWIGNMWLDDGVPAAPGNCDLWIAHFAYLIPNDEGQRDHFLDVMAFSMQHPNVKVRHALLFISLIQQNGKSTIFEAWERMVGKSNAVRVSNTELASQFQGGIFNKQFALLEEVFQRDRDLYNNMKDVITEPEKRVQLKGQDFVERRPPLIMVGFSNKSVPINGIEAGDQRWHVTEIDAERKDDAYYRRLRGEGWRQIPALKAWLLRRPLGHFDPAAPPPMTRAKLRLIADGRTPFDKALDVALEEHGRNVVVVEMLCQTIRSHARLFPSSVEVSDGLRQRGWTKRGQQRTGGPNGQRGTFYALGDEYKDAAPDTLRAALRWHGVGQGDE